MLKLNARFAMGIEVRVPPPDYPRSSAVNYVPPAPVTSEEDILQLLNVGVSVSASRQKLNVT